MIQINDPVKCCGCSACMNICAHGAITMQPDTLGFLYPVVDEKKCIECGLCEKVCAFHEDYDKSFNLSKPIAFAVRHRNISEVETSRSGAIFIALSDWILEQGGVIYGAGYGEHFRVTHKKATTKEERDEFKGSKYTQSDLSSVFSDIREDLKKGMTVLFSGTPCQTAGLQSFILNKRLKEKLFLIDIVCHGVVSPFIWDAYLSFLEKKVGKRIVNVNFRDKNIFGWSGLHKESFLFFGEKKRRTFNYTFYDNRMMRLSCNQCPFTNLCRPSDITIGDLWGWQKVSPNMNTDDKGCSLVLCNTPKGIDWFEKIKERVFWNKVNLEECMQPNLVRPTQIHGQRREYEEDFRLNGFQYIYRKYGDVGIGFQLRRIRNFILRVTKKIWRK